MQGGCVQPERTNGDWNGSQARQGLQHVGYMRAGMRIRIRPGTAFRAELAGAYE